MSDLSPILPTTSFVASVDNIYCASRIKSYLRKPSPAIAVVTLNTLVVG